MTKLSEWREGVKDGAKKRPSDVWIEGRFIMYHPTFTPSHEAKERGGRWDGRHNAWRLPKLSREARWIMEYDPNARVTKGIHELAAGSWETHDLSAFKALNKRHKHLKDLYPYQQEAVAALVTRPYHGEMLALSPGLGKTPTSIVASDLLTRTLKYASKRILVVAPLSLVRNWEREITRWSDDPRVEITHQAPPTPDRSVKWTVTNYDTVMERDKVSGRTVATGNLREDYDLDWDVVIFDESVLLKNRKSKRASSCRTLARAAKKVFLLSGAPATRNNSDLWQQFNIQEPDYFSSFWRFTNETCVVVRTPWSQGEIVGSRRDISIRDEFPEIMYVRNQEEVLPDLPDYIFQDVPLELTKKQRKAHDEILDVWIHELEENRSKRVEVTAVIAMLTRLQQVTSNLYNLETTGTEWPDESTKADFVEETLDIGEVEWPVLIWTHHRPGAKALLTRLQKKAKKKDSALYKKRVELVYGGMKNSDELIEDYKAGKIDVLVLGIQVGKYGHTLVNTRTVVTYDKTWDSDAWFQMLHRVRRNGLNHRPLVLNPRCVGSIDTFVEMNLAGKLPAMASITGSDLAKVLRSLGEEYINA